MQILNPSTSAKQVMTKLQKMLDALTWRIIFCGIYSLNRNTLCCTVPRAFADAYNWGFRISENANPILRPKFSKNYLKMKKMTLERLTFAC